MLIYEPPTRLSYTWGPPEDNMSEVTFELTPQGKNVLLVLTHIRLGDNKTELLSVASGWHTHLNIFDDQLNGVISKGFWSTHTKLEGEYERMI